MRLTFKTHFPWPGADGKPVRTHFVESILSSLVGQDTGAQPDAPGKHHTIRRVKMEPRFREGMTLQFCTGPRFKQKVFAEAPCTRVYLLRMDVSFVPGHGYGLTVDREDGVGAFQWRPLTQGDIERLARNDGLGGRDFYRWFQADVLQNGPGNYELVCWTDVRY